MKSNRLNRRKFLRNTSLGFLGAGFFGKNSFASSVQDQENELPKIKEYRTLGRTGFKVSDIGCGPVLLTHENVLKALINSGVNYIDSAIQYGKKNELIIGRAIEDYDRKSLFITSKYWIKENTTKDDIINQFHGVLERMQTDYIDCLQIHSVISSEQLKNESFHQAIKQLKNEKKLNFLGVSCHGSSWYDNTDETMEEILENAIYDGRFDVLLLVYNFVQQDMGKRILDLCVKKNIGATIMKTNPFGGFSLDLLDQYETLVKEDKEIPKYLQTIHDKYKENQNKAKPFLDKYKLNDYSSIRDAAIRFVLTNQDTNSLIYSFRNFDDVDNIIGLSGTKLSEENLALLYYYREFYGELYCHIGCNTCESKCPHNVPVNTIMRYNYYFTNKQQEKYAMQKYQELPGGKPNLCINCEGYCEQACPYGVLTRPLLAIAHQNLSIDSPLYT